MKRPFLPKIATANDLFSGAVVYFEGGGWASKLSEARVARTPEEADALLSAANGLDGVVGAYLVDVDAPAGAAPRPRHVRELLRDRGPSNRPDLGRQAVHAAGI